MARPLADHPIRKYRLTLCLHEGQDDDLIALLESTPEGYRAKAVISAMRQGVQETAVFEDSADDGIADGIGLMMFD